MKIIILPFRLKKQKGILTRLVYNENQYIKNFDLFLNEVNKIYNSIPNIEITKGELKSQILNAHITENHTVFNIGTYFTLKLINIDKIPQFHTVESMANSIK
jgi:hypothetical protein